MRSSLLRALVVSVLLAGAGQAARAQFVISNAEVERSLRPAPYVYFDGVPYTQRYNNATGFLYVGGNSAQLWDQYYLDRIDRAERFGYELPPEPIDSPHFRP